MRPPLRAAARLLALAIGSTSGLSFAQVSPQSAEMDLRPKVGFGAPIICLAPGPRSTLVVAAADPQFVVSPSVESWVTKEMARVGFGAALPKQPGAHSAALRVAELLKRGNIVAAMMANEETASTIPAYKASPFSANFESLLTILTQPVLHASYPSSTQADGEAPASAAGRHTHGGDLESVSRSLMEIIRRAQMSKKALGVTYEIPAVRYYILATGLHDSIALKAATASVCALGLSESVRAKLDISARFMVMPAAGSSAVASGAK